MPEQRGQALCRIDARHWRPHLRRPHTLTGNEAVEDTTPSTASQKDDADHTAQASPDTTG